MPKDLTNDLDRIERSINEWLARLADSSNHLGDRINTFEERLTSYIVTIGERLTTIDQRLSIVAGWAQNSVAAGGVGEPHSQTVTDTEPIVEKLTSIDQRLDTLVAFFDQYFGERAERLHEIVDEMQDTIDSVGGLPSQTVDDEDDLSTQVRELERQVEALRHRQTAVEDAFASFREQYATSVIELVDAVASSKARIDALERRFEDGPRSR